MWPGKILQLGRSFLSCGVILVDGCQVGVDMDC